MPISKTDFVRGLQCEKMLWLDAHAPELKIIPPEVQAKLDAGNEFGDQAMGLFGDFVETTTLKEDGRLNFAAMIEKTQSLLSKGEGVICEAAFTWYGNFCAADILKKEDGGYALYEVKNTHFVREEFLTDLGFQAFLLQKCGVCVTKVFLVLRGDEPPQDSVNDTMEDFATYRQVGDFRYRIVEVTTKIRRAKFLASERIFELGKLKRKDAQMPQIPVGCQCETPYRCWYYEHCHK